MKGQVIFSIMMVSIGVYCIVRVISIMGSLEHKANTKGAAEVITRNMR